MKLILALTLILTIVLAQVDFPPAFEVSSIPLPSTVRTSAATAAYKSASSDLTATASYRPSTISDAPIVSSLYKTSDTPTTGVDASGIPAASIAAESFSTEPAQPQIQALYVMSPGSTYTPPKNYYNIANDYWNAATTFGQTCCGNCNKFCGVAFKITGSNRYVTNINNIYLAFQASNNPNSNQIFTLNQNSDCTWSISNNNRYLSTSNSNGGNWISFSPTIGAPQRWYLERHGAHTHIQSAYLNHKFWTADSSSSSILRYNYGSSYLTMQIYPCDKTWGWN